MANLNEEDRANLVAYLDGELDDDAAHALESKLNLDPQARAEADSLRRTWELLDYLPKPEPSTDFTHRTLSRLAIKPITGKQPALTAKPRRRRWYAPLGWAAAVLLAAAGGYGVAQLLWPRPTAVPEGAEVSDTLARHLRVIENKPLYDVVDDMEFLRALDHSDLFGDDGE